MTREEAIEIIECGEISNRWGKDGEEVEKMAIKALKQEPCDKCVYSTSEGCQYDDITETIPPFETSDDAISRQAVLDTLENMDRALDEDRTVENYKELLRECYKVLPPVNPQKPICPSAGVDCEDCPAYEDAISRKAVTDALCSDCELYKDGKRTCFLKCEEYHFLTTLPPVVTKEERALLQRWRDNRGVSMEEFAKALELLKEGKA